MPMQMNQTRWLRIVVEAVVIVGSILLAFGIDAWWEGRKEAEATDQLLSLLASQMESNAGVLEGDVRLAETATSSLGALVRSMSVSPDPVSTDSLLSLVSPGLSMSDTFLETAALDEILSSGQLDAVRDSVLHRALVEFRSRTVLRRGDLDRFVESRSRVVEHLNPLLPMAARYFPEVAGQFPASSVAILTDLELQGLLAGLWWRQELRLRRSRIQLEVARRILNEVD